MEDPFLDYQIYNHAMMYAQYRQLAYRQPIWQGKQHSLISPFAPGATQIPYLSQEPPILQNPERVVRSTECERFERSFQPNVALAPRKIPSQSRDHTEQRDIREKSVIKCDIQIKQERPATPILKSDSPELRSTETTAVVIKQSAISPGKALFLNLFKC